MLPDIRAFGNQGQRVETGPIQFGDDWPGVFIRGDNALFYAFVLQQITDKGDRALKYYGHVVKKMAYVMSTSDLKLRRDAVDEHPAVPEESEG